MNHDTYRRRKVEVGRKKRNYDHEKCGHAFEVRRYAISEVIALLKGSEQSPRIQSVQELLHVLSCFWACQAESNKAKQKKPKIVAIARRCTHLLSHD